MVDGTDLTWVDGPAAYWTAIEINTGIQCGCLPTLKPLLVRFVPWLGNKGWDGVDTGQGVAEIREMTITTKTEERVDSVISGTTCLESESYTAQSNKSMV